MAILSTCAKIFTDQDVSCDPPARKYYQQAVLINKTDILSMTITKPDYVAVPPVCNYNIEFALKSGLRGFRFTGPEAGNSYRGYFDKSRSDLGFSEYKHNGQILMAGISEAIKCGLESLDKGLFILALQLTDGTVEIYGAQNGLTTGDYTYDIAEGGGGVPVLLSSLDSAPEKMLPLVFKSSTPGNETIDFDANFAAP